MRPFLLLAVLASPALAQAPASPAARAAIAQAVADPGRPATDTARDAWRHPVETLAFFGVAPGRTVVEYSPGGGWYTRILAPLERDGRYVALVQNRPKDVAAIKRFLAADPARFGKAQVAMVDPVTGTSSVPDGSADVVLTFRNVHNLLMQGNNADGYVFKAFYAMLKPGGVLGLVEHRLPETRDPALERTSGYVRRSTVIRIARAAGFQLAGESQVNANPRDDADHPKGVWTLPPTLDLGATDRAKYLAIGESDRMTLRFVKPKPVPVRGLPPSSAAASAPAPIQ